MFNFFHFVGYEIFYRPLFNALVLIYNFLPGHDLGIAIAALTLLVRLAMYPLSAKAFHSARSLAAMQPKVQELNEKLKYNKEELSRKTLELYKQEGVHPFSALLPLLLQFPILITLYRVFAGGLAAVDPAVLYSFVQSPGHISQYFLGFLNIANPSIAVALLSGALQFVQSKQTTQKTASNNPQAQRAAQAQTVALFAAPLITTVFLLRLPSALGIYWIATSAFTVAQQWYLAKKSKPAPQ